MMLSCWLTWYVWFKVVRLFHVDQSGNFIYKKNWILGLISLSTILPEPYDTIHLKKPHALSLGYMLSSIKFCDPAWFCSDYALDFRFYVQMNHVLLKYCLAMFIRKKRERKRDEKMACQRSMTQKKREKRWHAKEAWPSNKIRHENEHVFICALTWPVVNMIMHLWIQFFILQQIWAKQKTFYLIHRDSTYTIKISEVK